ncbi:MAG: hypothetical protein SFV22_20035 [Saprospiraceae bacterium]|nr:hypothetical protein [Saprospiraceae bacterium]
MPKTVLFLLLVGLLVFQSSCAFYQRYGMSKSRLQKINTAGLSVYLIDAAHPLTRGWYLSEPQFDADLVRGYVRKMEEKETLEVSMLRNQYDAQHSRNDVLIFLKPQFADKMPDSTLMNIPHSQLERVEVCEMNHVRTIGVPLIGCTGLALLAYLVSDW